VGADIDDDVDDDMAAYVDNNIAAYIDDDMSAYMDDVDDDVATSLAHQICTAHKNSSPPHHISDYSSNP